MSRLGSLLDIRPYVLGLLVMDGVAGCERLERLEWLEWLKWLHGRLSSRSRRDLT